VAGRQERLGDQAEPAPERARQPFAVEGQEQRAADAEVGEHRIVEVEPEVDVVRSDLGHHAEARIALEQVDDVGRHGVEHQLHRPLAQLEHTHGGVGDLAQHHPVELRAAAVEAVEGGEGDQSGRADHAERPVPIGCRFCSSGCGPPAPRRRRR
jgi:hypothetical protein